MNLDDGPTGTLAYWERVELAMMREKASGPIHVSEWNKGRIRAAKAWIEASNRDFSVRKKYDMSNRKAKA